MIEIQSLSASEAADAADCVGTCIQTREFTALEPGDNEFKYYAPGIGVMVAFHEDEPEERENLVEIIYPE